MAAQTNHENTTAQTHLSSTIDAVDLAKERYDENVKALLADIQILAYILKYTVTEVQGLEIDEIMACIDPESIEIGTVPVSPGLTNTKRVESRQTEDSVPNEGYITFDIRFALTSRKKSVKIIINLEAQKSTEAGKLGYHLENRIIYYMARLISSQKETEFFHSDYDNLKKIYSIWICMEGTQDSVTRIALAPDTVFGVLQRKMNFDKICGVIVQLRKENSATESKNKLIAMLEDLLRNEERSRKKEKLTTKYGMRMTVELEGRLAQMCNLSDIVEERGIEQGIERGKQAEIFSSVQDGDYSAERGAQKMGISVDEFRKCMKEAGYRI